MKHEFQVSANKLKLWVNSGETGMSIARFSATGIDIHNDTEGQLRGDVCLFCRPGPEPANPVPLEEQWVLFKSMLKKHHGITVPKSVKLKTRRTA